MKIKCPNCNSTEVRKISSTANWQGNVTIGCQACGASFDVTEVAWNSRPRSS